MRLGILAVVMLCVGALGRCVCSPEPAPGEVGDTCDDEFPCGEGLRCVDGECAVIGADAGSSDATVGDGAATDSARADSSLPDGAQPDARLPDGGAPDSAAADLVASDHSAAPDHSARPDHTGPGDTGNRPDHAVRRDTLYVPDTSGHDLAWLLDAQINVEGGIGVDIRGIDVGIGGYTGDEENGVVCGPATCDLGDPCCISLPPTLSCDDQAGQCSGAAASLACDGPEDCRSGQECCAAGFNTYCTAEDQCLSEADAVICVDDEDCPTYGGGSQMVCCASALFTGIGLDIGWCQTYCN